MYSTWISGHEMSWLGCLYIYLETRATLTVVDVSQPLERMNWPKDSSHGCTAQHQLTLTHQRKEEHTSISLNQFGTTLVSPSSLRGGNTSLIVAARGQCQCQCHQKARGSKYVQLIYEKGVSLKVQHMVSWDTNDCNGSVLPWGQGT